ncbi:hypothetical protein P43SY_006401 [Pythium insidiosum]|uniref:Uncharacterized protein n=1 Tax=Pythium insidiosum TaxID=114742 RepID=A0AAD5LBH0_PYTIN|nr:hypothetical protein P43SY_006401 [Pythium insidiosum]
MTGTPTTPTGVAAVAAPPTSKLAELRAVGDPEQVHHALPVAVSTVVEKTDGEDDEDDDDIAMQDDDVVDEDDVVDVVDDDDDGGLLVELAAVGGRAVDDDVDAAVDADVDDEDPEDDLVDAAALDFAAVDVDMELDEDDDGPATSSSVVVPTDATCMQFLDLMKAFSESSSCDVSEMAQRVDSLVSQDEYLSRLLPVTPTATPSACLSATSSVADTTDEDESSSARELLALESHEVLPQHQHQHQSMDEPPARIAAQRGNDDMDMDQWMEIEIELDCSVDPYDATLHLPGTETTLSLASSSSGTSASSVGRSIGFSSSSSSSSSNSINAAPIASPAAAPTVSRPAAMPVHTIGSHANSSSVLSTTTSAVAAASNRLRALATSSVFDHKSAKAALFGDDDDDDDDDDGDLVLLNSLARKKALAATSSAAPSTLRPAVGSTAAPPRSLLTKRPLEQEAKTDDDAGAGSIWGMEVDSLEQDLLLSIDHAVLCDRENRFLQWDLEIEAATAAAQAARGPSGELRTPPSSFSTTAAAHSFASDSARQKLLLASSPREHKMSSHSAAYASALRSPSTVDTNLLAEDWNALDFGTFQNRTVSHILSSCLHKRKLHHPYKDRVTLINFNVPGGEPLGPLPSQSPTNILPSGLLFGVGGVGGNAATDMELLGGGGAGLDAQGDAKDASGTSAASSKTAAKSGEKKPKKPREERKRQSAQKSMEMLAELEGTFSEQDLDARGNGASKLNTTKYEHWSLPDLTNLPQDLKELKRKIEATEHKVEGTKHRHRKGGPCPRCQVQNQLRAAKRAYHKRAVAHKKLPTLGNVSPALTATPLTAAEANATAAVTAMASAPSPPVMPAVTMTAPSTTPIVVKAAAPPAPFKPQPTLAPSQPVATPAPVVAHKPAAIPTSVPVHVPPVAAVAVPSQAPASTADAQVKAPTAVVLPPAPAPASAAALVGAVPTPSSSATRCMPLPAAPSAMAATATAAAFPRRPCGEPALPSAFVSPSSSSSEPSSPESSPQVHHVTVTSA